MNDCPRIPSRSAGQTAALLLLFALAGCTTTYTVDDGSPVDEKLLANIRAYGRGEQTIRPAIVRSAALNDKECSKQWELPFAVATSYDRERQERIAWARGLQVDERLTVIAATPETLLVPGDKIQALNGFKRSNTEKMLEELVELREKGKPFRVKLATGVEHLVTPVKVCRGHFQLASVHDPEKQDYHWLQSTHGLHLFQADFTPDEALWSVLWTQGLSEEAAVRMKTYHYGVKIVKTGIAVAGLVSGVQAAASGAQAAYATASAAAAQAASAQAANAASSAAMEAAGRLVAKQLAEKAKQEVQEAVKDALVEGAQKIAKDHARDMVIGAVASAPMFKKTLSGVSWVASTGFYMADKWAYERMDDLGADPLAGAQLHFKLASNNILLNAFILDEERLDLYTKLARGQGLDQRLARILAGGEILPVVAETVPAEVPAIGVTGVLAEQPSLEQRSLAPLDTAALPAAAAVTTDAPPHEDSIAAVKTEAALVPASAEPVKVADAPPPQEDTPADRKEAASASAPASAQPAEALGTR